MSTIGSMFTCPRCGATIDAAALACPYCHTQTQYGREFAERQAAERYRAAQADQAARSNEREARTQALRKKALHAVFFSLAGTFTCCFPLAIVGLVMGLNVKAGAKRDGFVAPASATLAVVLGASGIVVFVLAIVAAVLDDRKKEARVSVLETETADAREREAIDRRLACSLVELELLQEGYGTSSGTSIEGFQCDGRLERSGDSAALHDVRFRTSSSNRRVVTACLARGGRWSVKELREDGSCAPRAAVPPSGAASAR